MTDFRDFAIELVEDMGYDPKQMLIACLKYMSMDDVEDMLCINEYPQPAEDFYEGDDDFVLIEEF